MLVSAIIHFFELIVSLIPFDVPAFPSDVSFIINKFSEILSSSLSVIKSILPWNYFVILLRIVLFVEIGIVTYKYSIIIFKVVYKIVEKILSVLLEVFTSLKEFIKRLFAVT